MSRARLPVPSLHYYPSDLRVIRKIPVTSLPFVIGRAPDCDFVLSMPLISKRHAEVRLEGHEFWIRDLGSMNGLFVDGRRVKESRLDNNAVIQIAKEEFRFVCAADLLAASTNSQFDGLDGALEDFACTKKLDAEKYPQSLVLGMKYLKETLVQKSFRILFQPIVSLKNGQTLGYEALVRGTHKLLSANPADLFQLAERCGLAETLSQTVRRLTMQEVAKVRAQGRLFLNVHPLEIDSDSFLESLREIDAGDWEIVIEVHEDAMPQVASWEMLRTQLHALGMQAAFDDFGAGKARYLELAKVAPNFLKLDMRLVRDIHTDPSRQHLVQALVGLSKQFGVQVIAEGVETPGEAEVCTSLGCHYGQGYLFARPQIVTVIGEAAPPPQTCPSPLANSTEAPTAVLQTIGFALGETCDTIRLRTSSKGPKIGTNHEAPNAEDPKNAVEAPHVEDQSKAGKPKKRKVQPARQLK